MIRFVVYAWPLLMLLLAAFGFAVDLLDLEPRAGSVIRLAFFEQPRVPAQVVFGAWAMESCGLLALFLLAQGRCGSWWLDGLVAGWLGWVFRGPLLVVTLVVAARQPQDPWWQIAFGWWILYSICGLALGYLYHRTRRPEPESEADEASDPARLLAEAPPESIVDPVENSVEPEDSISVGIIDGPVDVGHAEIEAAPVGDRAIEADPAELQDQNPEDETPKSQSPEETHPGDGHLQMGGSGDGSSETGNFEAGDSEAGDSEAGDSETGSPEDDGAEDDGAEDVSSEQAPRASDP